MLARVLLAQDRPGPALALLDRLHPPAAARGLVAHQSSDHILAKLGAANRTEAVARVRQLGLIP